MSVVQQSRRRVFAFVGLGLLAGAIAYCYADVFAVLWQQWNDNDVFSHGFLIPIISGYIVWLRRHALAATPTRPAQLVGCAALLGGILVLTAGRIVGTNGVQQLSLLVALGAVVLCVRGWAALRLLAFPIGYLLFMMPVWDFLTERLHWPFQLASARLGASMLDLMSVPVFLDGNVLVLPNITLEVARVCSGVNYLIAVLAVGIPLAYFSFSDWPRRIVLVGFGVAIAALFNSVRVALIGVLAYYDLSQIRHGPGHVLQGLSVSLVGYLALFGCWALLTRCGPSRGPATDSVPESASHERSTMPIAGLLAAVAILVAGGATRTAARPPVSFDLNASIPLRLGSWTASANRAVEARPLPSTPWQDEVWREYRDRNGDAVTLYVGRYLKRRGSGTVPPFWTDRLDRSAVPFRLATGTGTMNVRHIEPRTGQDPDALLWYVLGDDVTTSRLLAKANGVIYRMSHSGPGPLVVVVTAAPGTRQSETVLRSFAAAVIPAVARRF